jgi:hypothetical protein
MIPQVGAARIGFDLQGLQSAARQKHLPEHLNLLDNYHVGERLDESRSVLETLSQNIIEKANQERPTGVNTEVIARAEAERAAFLATDSSQSSEASKAKQARALRDDLLQSITARRKKIQYAADNAWPPRQAASQQARADFKLPANRPYSY